MARIQGEDVHAGSKADCKTPVKTVTSSSFYGARFFTELVRAERDCNIEFLIFYSNFFLISHVIRVKVRLCFMRYTRGLYGVSPSHGNISKKTIGKDDDSLYDSSLVVMIRSKCFFIP